MMFVFRLCGDPFCLPGFLHFGCLERYWFTDCFFTLIICHGYSDKISGARLSLHLQDFSCLVQFCAVLFVKKFFEFSVQRNFDLCTFLCNPLTVCDFPGNTHGIKAVAYRIFHAIDFYICDLHTVLSLSHFSLLQ